MKEFESNNPVDRELTDFIAMEVDEILREMTEGEAAPTAEDASDEREEAGPTMEEVEESEEAPAEEAAPTSDESAEAEEDEVLTDEEIEASCRQALEELLPEAPAVQEAVPKQPPSAKKLMLAAVVTAVLLIAVVLGGTAVHVSNLKTIFPKVSVMGTNIGGMTVSEAEKALERAEIGNVEDIAIRLEMPGGLLELNYSDVGLGRTAEEIAELAYDYGRKTNIVGSTVQYLRSSLFGTALDDRIINLPTEDYVDILLGKAIKDAEVALFAEVEIDTEAQTLTVIKGAQGIKLDRSQMLKMLMKAIKAHEYGTLTYTPAAIDNAADEVAELHEQHCAEPKDAVYNKETGEIEEETIGLQFELEAAKALWEAAEIGDTVVIPVEITMPKHTKAHLEEVLFSVKLGESVSPVTGTENRKSNVKQAIKALDGLILLPGEQISYNALLGERTPERGYQMAPSYFGDKVVQTYGGGICQVSSGLYHASLLSNLQIDERSNHGFRVSYLPLSYDATVSWGGPDLKITNNREYPVRIHAYMEGNNLVVNIYGTDDGTYVKLTYGSSPAFTDPAYPDVQTGIMSQAIRRVYDIATNALLKTEKLGTDIYMFHAEQIQYPTPSPSVTPEPSPEVTPTPDVSTSPEVTEAPTPTQVPTPTPVVTEPPTPTPEQTTEATPVPVTPTEIPVPTSVPTEPPEVSGSENETERA